MSPLDPPLDPTARAFAALRRGADPRASLLDALLRRAGGSLAIWVPSEEGARPHVRRRGAAPAVCAGELPRHLPWPLLLGLPPGSSRRLDRRWLDRWPGPRLFRLEEALAARSREGGRLWLEGGGRLALTQPEFRDWARGLADFESLERERRERVAAAELVRRGEAAAGIAHDLRNQLSLASLVLDRMREEGDLDGGADSLARALGEARALSQSFLSRSGTTRVAKPLRGLLEEELRAALELVRRRDVCARLKCPRGLATAADEVLLRRILRNLLLNAMHAVCDGGSVRISAETQDASRVRIAVEDDGRGMDERQLERWVRAGSSGRGSTGFGTTSVLDCVRELEAELVVESARGRGTTCTVVVRRAETGARDAVVVCESDPLRRERLVRRLEDRGQRALGASTAEWARTHLDEGGAVGLLVARGMRDESSRALRIACRAAGTPLLELSTRDDESRALRELCRAVGLRRAPKPE